MSATDLMEGLTLHASNWTCSQASTNIFIFSPLFLSPPFSLQTARVCIILLIFAASTQSSCLVTAAAYHQFQHSLRTVTIVFCWGACAWHSLTYVQLLTSQTCLL